MPAGRRSWTTQQNLIDRLAEEMGLEVKMLHGDKSLGRGAPRIPPSAFLRRQALWRTTIRVARLKSGRFVIDDEARAVTPLTINNARGILKMQPGWREVLNDLDFEVV